MHYPTPPVQKGEARWRLNTENVSPDTEVKLGVNKNQHHKALHTQIVNLFLL